MVHAKYFRDDDCGHSRWVYRLKWSNASLGEKGNQVFPPLLRDHADFPANMFDETPIVLGDDFIPLDPYQDPYESFGVVFIFFILNIHRGVSRKRLGDTPWYICW